MGQTITMRCHSKHLDKCMFNVAYATAIAIIIVSICYAGINWPLGVNAEISIEGNGTVLGKYSCETFPILARGGAPKKDSFAVYHFVCLS